MLTTAYAAGAVDRRVYLRAFVASTGLPYTAGAFNTAGIAAQYIRNGAAAVSITLATQTAAGAHSDGGFVHVAAGVYRLDVPDAAFASGADWVDVVVSGITDVVFTVAHVELLGGDPRAATVAVGSIAADAINAAAIAADAVTELQAGLATAAALANVQADTDNLQTRLPAALVGGRIDASVGAVANDAITAAGVAADVGTEIAAATFARAFNAEMANLTFEQVVGLMASVLLGQASGLGTTTATFRNPANNADAVVATVDANGNRTAVTLAPAAVS